MTEIICCHCGQRFTVKDIIEADRVFCPQCSLKQWCGDWD